MSIAATIDQGVLDATLDPIALMYYPVTGDIQAARLSAWKAVAAHRPENEDELTLAGEIVSFSAMASDAMVRSMSPDITDAKALAWRNAAVRFAKQSHAARRGLAQLRRAAKPAQADLQPGQPQPQEPTAPQPASPVPLQPAIHKSRRPDRTNEIPDGAFPIPPAAATAPPALRMTG